MKLLCDNNVRITIKIGTKREKDCQYANEYAC